MKTIINIIVLTGILVGCKTGNKTIKESKTYIVDEIENRESFFEFSEIEKDRLKTNNESYKPANDKGTPDSIEVKRREHFRNNNSKWDIKTIVNGKIRDSTFHDGQYARVNCDCVLDKNQIQINLGVRVFSKILVKIIVKNKKYNVKYIEGLHKKMVYKYSLKDSLLEDEVELDVVKSRFTLINQPKFEIHETLQGMIEFETPKYYIDSKFNEYGIYGEPDPKMDSIITKGKIYITCELRKKKNY